MGLQEHDLIMADEIFSGKTVKNSSSRACWAKRLGKGRVVRKSVNANPGVKVNRSMNFSCI